MKQFTITLFTLLLAVSTASAAIGTPPFDANSVLTDPDLVDLFATDGEQITVDDFLNMTPKSIRKATGERLGMKKAVALKAAQRAIRTEMRQAAKAEAAAEDVAGGDRNQLVALILAVVLGGFGVHSFYMGKTLKGIAQILLLVTSFLIVPGIALLAWIIYDIITIATGSQEPKNGIWDPEL